MVNYYLNEHQDSDKSIVLCGIEFVELKKNSVSVEIRFTSIPRYYKDQSVRKDWRTLLIMPQINPPGPRENKSIGGGEPGYYREGFLYIQHQLSLAAAQAMNGLNTEMKVNFEAQRFPFPPYVDDTFLFVISFLFPSLIVFSFIYPSVNLTKSLVIEKELRLKESMKMMGMKEKYHWIAHFLKSILWSIISLVLIVTFLFVKFSHDLAILNFSDVFVVFLFFFLYEVSNICLCFAISSFFSKVGKFP